MIAPIFYKRVIFWKRMRAPLSTRHALPLSLSLATPPFSVFPNSQTYRPTIISIYINIEKINGRASQQHHCKRTLKRHRVPKDQRQYIFNRQQGRRYSPPQQQQRFLGSMHWHDLCDQTWATESVTSTDSFAFSFAGCDRGVSDMSGSPPASAGPEPWDPDMNASAYDQHPLFLSDAAPHMASPTSPPRTSSLSHRATGTSSFRHQQSVASLEYSTAVVGSVHQHTAAAPHPAAHQQQGGFLNSLILPLNSFENPVEEEGPPCPEFDQATLDRAIVESSATFAQLGIAETTYAQTGTVGAYHPKSMDTMQSQPCPISLMLLPNCVSDDNSDQVPLRTGSTANSSLFSSAGPSRQGVSNSNAVLEQNIVISPRDAQDGIATLANMSNSEEYIIGDEPESPGGPSAVQPGGPSMEPESRRGKNRVFNACFACNQPKHIRSNQCKWCGAPKGPLAKRRPRPKPSN
jgi:hypothetical protein